MSNEDVVRMIDDHRLDPPDDPEPIGFCTRCGAEIYVGSRAIGYYGDLLCEDCAEQIRDSEGGTHGKRNC